MDMVIGISNILFGIILFAAMLIPTIMAVGGGSSNLLKAFAIAVTFLLPAMMIWMGWSFTQHDPIVPSWVGCLAPLSPVLLLAGSFFIDREDVKKSHILQIEPADVSRIVREGADLNADFMDLKSKHKITEIIHHAAIIAQAIQLNDPDYHLPVEKDCPYSTGGIEEISLTLTGLYSPEHFTTEFFKMNSPASKDELLLMAEKAAGLAEPERAALLRESIGFFKSHRGAMDLEEDKEIAMKVGGFLFMVTMFLYEQEQEKSKLAVE